MAASPTSRWLALALAALTLGLYARTTAFAFVDFDDDVYVTANPHVTSGLSAQNLRWAFTTGHAANWHPLTWISHQLDVELFGLHAGGHHGTNAWLHALNAALFFAVLHAMTGAPWRSALAAALFAWHPLRVEVAAWVSERKELLATGLALASLAAWTSWVRRRHPARYGASLLLFLLALCAKPMPVTLPFALLVLDAWPLARLELGWRRRVLEKLPFFALAAAAAFVTWHVQRSGGAMNPDEILGPGARLGNAARSAGVYLGKTLVPTDLAAFHPHPCLTDSASAGKEALVALLVLSALSVLGVRLRRRVPALLTGWLWFLGTLVPVLGLVQVGSQGWAERYTYFPSLGLAWLTVWGGAAVARTPRARSLAAVLAFAVLGLSALASARQIETWRDTGTLTEHAVAVDESGLMHANLGRVREHAGAAAEAERHYRRALELTPTLVSVRVSLARLLRQRGSAGEARSELETALAAAPDLAPAHADLGWLLAQEGRDAEALVHLREACALLPAEPSYTNLRAWILATSRSAAAPAEALALAEALCARSREPHPGYLGTRAAALARLGRFEEAVRWQTLALEGAPVPERATLTRRLELYRKGQPFLKSP